MPGLRETLAAQAGRYDGIPICMPHFAYRTNVPLMAFIELARAAGLMNDDEERAYRVLVAAKSRILSEENERKKFLENYA